MVETCINHLAYWKNILRLACEKCQRLVIEIGRVSVYLSDELEKKLRIKTVERFGGRKGDLSRAVEEAIMTWVENE